jgi:quinol monooxygenase YgiN
MEAYFFLGCWNIFGEAAISTEMPAISSIQPEGVMYARITTYHCKTETMDDAIALFKKMKPEIMRIPGLKHLFHTGNQDGNCALIGIYNSREAAEAATESAKAFFDRFAEYIDSELQPLGYEVLVHGTNP